jgi:Acetyltransferase (GNAT) domain
MELSLLSQRPKDWNQQIRAFVGKSLFHESAWLDFVASAYPNLTVQYLQMRDGSCVAGYLCVMQMKKLNYLIWGSPVQYIGMYLGPVLAPGTDQYEFMRVVNDYCVRNGIANFELCNCSLNPTVMQSLGFRAKQSVTVETSLRGGEEGVWGSMRGPCRTRIRKALKSELVGELTSDPVIVSLFYRHFTMVLNQKGIAPPYGIERPYFLFQHLSDDDKLFAVRVRYRDKVIASAFYPHDDFSMYYWDSGYNPEFVHLSPNELLHWTAIKAAIDRGIKTFIIGGAPNPSRFSQKFGGELVPYIIYEKSFKPVFNSIRHAYNRFRTLAD